MSRFWRQLMGLKSVLIAMLVFPLFPPVPAAHAQSQKEARRPSPYELCPTPLKAQSAAVLYACAESEFWHALSDGRLEVRRQVEAHLSEIMLLTSRAAESEKVKRGRIFGLRAYLRLAMALENSRLEYVLFGGIERDFKNAMRDDTSNKVYRTFYDTMLIAKPAMSGQWEQAIAASGPAFDFLPEFPTNILSLSGTTIGFPLKTGIPQKTIRLMEEWVCPADQREFCTSNTQKAPHARPGLNFHFAEAYARVGNKEKTLHYLLAARAAPGYSEWPYQELVEKPMSELDQYMAYWASFGEDGSVFDKVYANQNYGCVMCHGR